MSSEPGYTFSAASLVSPGETIFSFGTGAHVLQGRTIQRSTATGDRVFFDVVNKGIKRVALSCLTHGSGSVLIMHRGFFRYQKQWQHPDKWMVPSLDEAFKQMLSQRVGRMRAFLMLTLPLDERESMIKVPALRNLFRPAFDGSVRSKPVTVRGHKIELYWLPARGYETLTPKLIVDDKHCSRLASRYGSDTDTWLQPDLCLVPAKVNLYDTHRDDVDDKHIFHYPWLTKTMSGEEASAKILASPNFYGKNLADVVIELAEKKQTD